MRGVGHAITAAIGGLALVTTVASTARAGCTDPAVPGRQPIQLSWINGPGHPAGFSLPGNDDWRTGNESIVGLWQFTFSSVGNDVEPLNIPDQALLDSGYAQWHSDGTEIMNSSRDPATSNFCLGVWKKIGVRTYRLNHFALSWDNTGTLCTPENGAPSCFVGPTNIREVVTVGPHGNGYTGQVTIGQYDTGGHLSFQLHGTIAAHRITPD